MLYWKLEDIITSARPLRMESEANKMAITKKNYIKTYCRADFEKLLLTIEPQISIYNVYGSVIFKRFKGCTHYYERLNSSKKHHCWTTACNSLENETLEHLKDNNFCTETFNMDIKNILKLTNFNKIKQIMIRLYRNNLFLNMNAQKWKKSNDDKCWACREQRETRLHLFGLCKKTYNIVQYLTRLLKRAGYLEHGNTIEIFLF